MCTKTYSTVDVHNNFHLRNGIYILTRCSCHTQFHLHKQTCHITLHYIKSYLECPKSLRTARTLYEIKGVMWEYSYVGKHLQKR